MFLVNAEPVLIISDHKSKPLRCLLSLCLCLSLSLSLCLSLCLSLSLSLCLSLCLSLSLSLCLSLSLSLCLSLALQPLGATFRVYCHATLGTLL